MDEKTAWEKVREILRRGNDVEIRRCKDGIVILEVKKEIQYRTA